MKINRCNRIVSAVLAGLLALTAAGCAVAAPPPQQPVRVGEESTAANLAREALDALGQPGPAMALGAKSIPPENLAKAAESIVTRSAGQMFQHRHGAGYRLPDIGETETVAVRDEYTMPVPGPWTVGPGQANIPLSFYYAGESYMLGNVYSRPDGVEAFQQNPAAASRYISQQAAEQYGELLQFISFDTEPCGDDGDIYIVYLGLGTEDTQLEVTACYRFTPNMCAQFIGINMGDMPEMFYYTQAAALAFQDQVPDWYAEYGIPYQPLGLVYAGPFVSKPWDLPMENLFAILAEYTRWYFPDAPSPQRQKTDYVVEWTSPDMEAMARLVTGKTGGDLLASDLDAITRLDLRDGVYASNGNTLRISSDFYGGNIPTSGPITDISDLRHFSNLERVTLFTDSVADISVLRELPRINTLYLSLSDDLVSLEPLGALTELRSLMLWSGSYHNITDISCLSTLVNLEEITLSGRNVRDFSVLTTLPRLTKVLLIGYEDMDRQPLIDCERITSLVINTQQYR